MAFSVWKLVDLRWGNRGGDDLGVERKMGNLVVFLGVFNHGERERIYKWVVAGREKEGIKGGKGPDINFE